jgi:uncharacterized protein
MVEKGRKNKKKIDRRNKAVISRVIKILKGEEIEFQKIILFGSQARGDARPDSDFDFCIVVSDLVENPQEIQRQASKHVALAGIPADFFVATAKQYNTDRVSPLLHEVRKDGIMLN